MSLATIYTQAIERLIREKGLDEGTVFEKLRTHLAATGRLKLLPQIARELKVLEARRASSTPQLEVASEGERQGAEAAARAQGAEVEATINPDLIRGWRLRANGKVIDRSAKRALVEIYRKIVA